MESPGYISTILQGSPIVRTSWPIQKELRGVLSTFCFILLWAFFLSYWSSDFLFFIFGLKSMWMFLFVLFLLLVWQELSCFIEEEESIELVW